MKKETQLVNLGRESQFTGAAVNPAIVRASTVLFDSLEDLETADQQKLLYVDNYGRRGTSTAFALRSALCDLESAAGCYLYSCGTAAITSALLSFVSTGDHLLMVDTVYGSTRNFAEGTLRRMGVDVEFYSPLLASEIATLFKPNTKVVYLESPGSLTMEVQDLPSIAQTARQHGAVTMIDNTYASPYNLKPLELGIDISIHSATKYLNGHSDVMLGVASANQQYWPQLAEGSYELGQCASADDIYATLRGMRTLGIRLREQASNALAIARYLDTHHLVDHLRHPAFASCPGHEFYQRDATGHSGLFSFVLKQGNDEALRAMLNNMQHFKLGYSWGGYESLIMSEAQFHPSRSATGWKLAGPLIRLSIGLENTDDLLADLEAGLLRYAAAL